MRSEGVWVTGRKLVAFAVAAGLAMVLPAAADTMKCGRYRVSVGDSKAKVLELCGEPAVREVVSGGEGSTSARMEQWIYDRGERHFQAMLTFEGTTLKQIEFLSRQ